MDSDESLEAWQDSIDERILILAEQESAAAFAEVDRQQNELRCRLREQLLRRQPFSW